MKCSTSVGSAQARRVASGPRFAARQRQLRHTLATPVRLVPACVLLTCLLGTPAFAQQPFVVDDAEVTPRRAWQLEMNLEWDKLRLSARPNLSQTVFDAELGYGLAPRLEVSVDVPVIGLAQSRPVDRGRAETGDVTGIGDMAIAAKYRLTRDADGEPRVCGQPRRSSCRRDHGREGSARAWWTSG